LIQGVFRGFEKGSVGERRHGNFLVERRVEVGTEEA